MIFRNLYTENHPPDRLRSTGSNPVGTARDDTKELTRMVSFLYYHANSSHQIGFVS